MKLHSRSKKNINADTVRDKGYSLQMSLSDLNPEDQ